jgi:tryptophanyl-tRNA synthetase
MRIVSGMRPTGRLHLGHYFGVIRNWVKLQREHQTLFFIADWHALTTGYKDTKRLKKNVLELMIDWLALGLDPERSVLFIQSKVKEHAELHLLFSMITPKSWLEWNPTYKDMKYNLLKLQDLELQFRGALRDHVREFLGSIPYKIEDFERLEEHLLDAISEAMVEAVFEGEIDQEILKSLNVSKRDFYETDTYGFLGYPVLQAADILIYKGEGVPVGEDQLPHIELTREIARRFNFLYGDVFPEPQALLTEMPKVPGTDGRKMSKSYNNAIFFGDTSEEVRDKIMNMFTDPQKLRKNDPGRPDICSVFTYHKLFTGNTQEVEQIRQDCTSGKLGCVECKRRVIESLEGFISPFREQRQALLKRKDTIEEIFIEGSEKAREIALQTMEQVREAVNL